MSSQSGAAPPQEQPPLQWPPSQEGPQQWLSFHHSHSSPNAGSSHHSAPGLLGSQSAGPTGYQSDAFAMPGLSSLRQQPGAEHSLFSGTPNSSSGFPPSHFRQRSRFQFAQEHAAALAADPASSSHPSLMVSPALQQHSSPFGQEYGSAQHHWQLSEHQLFPSNASGPGASLFAGHAGLASSGSGPHQLSMHMAASSSCGDLGDGSAAMMGHAGLLAAFCTHLIYLRVLFCSSLTCQHLSNGVVA